MGHSYGILSIFRGQYIGGILFILRNEADPNVNF